MGRRDEMGVEMGMGSSKGRGGGEGASDHRHHHPLPHLSINHTMRKVKGDTKEQEGKADIPEKSSSHAGSP